MKHETENKTKDNQKAKQQIPEEDFFVQDTRDWGAERASQISYAGYLVHPLGIVMQKVRTEDQIV